MAKYEGVMNKLWGNWSACNGCHTTIALAARVLWDGKGFVHAGHIRGDDAVSWSEVTFPGYKDSVAERLRKKKEEEEEERMLEVA